MIFKVYGAHLHIEKYLTLNKFLTVYGGGGFSFTHLESLQNLVCLHGNSSDILSHKR